MEKHSCERVRKKTKINLISCKTWTHDILEGFIQEVQLPNFQPIGLIQRHSHSSSGIETFKSMEHSQWSENCPVISSQGSMDGQGNSWCQVLLHTRGLWRIVKLIYPICALNILVKPNIANYKGPHVHAYLGTPGESSDYWSELWYFWGHPRELLHVHCTFVFMWLIVVVVFVCLFIHSFIHYLFGMIIRVMVVFRKTVVGDWHFDYLSGRQTVSH